MVIVTDSLLLLASLHHRWPRQVEVINFDDEAIGEDVLGASAAEQAQCLVGGQVGSTRGERLTGDEQVGISTWINRGILGINWG